MNDDHVVVGYESVSQDTEVKQVVLNLKRANRHGLIAGATGTGKTVTMQALAESFANVGVPVLLADVKGDVSGISQAGKTHPKINERLLKLGLPTDAWSGCPTLFWDLYAKQGHPIRATISDMGPLLIGRLLGLNDTQEGILNIAFAVADDQGLLLLDLKDLRSMLNHIGEHAAELRTLYGNISPSSVGAIQRRLLVLDRGGAKVFFGEPMLELDDLMQIDADGRGFISVLVADKLMEDPAVYSTMLLWLLSELFEELPEVGDPDKPRLVLFFDEAHLLFKDTPTALVDKIEQVVRLIRSKGVGVYFVTQSPADLPDAVLAQLGNRFQHALRAFTPREQQAVKVAAQTFRSDGSFSVTDAIGQLGVGEALVSTLQPDGSPSFVRVTKIKPPLSRLGPATRPERAAVMSVSPISGKYDQAVDRESAFEKLKLRAENAADAAQRANTEVVKPKAKAEPSRTQAKPKNSNRQGVGEAFIKSVMRTVGNGIGRSLVRGILGSLFKGR